MILQTSQCDFLIEDSGKNDGSVFVYSEQLDELQRLFGSFQTEYSPKPEWKYRVSTCKQDLANKLILIVKEVNYSDFPRVRCLPV